MKADVIHAKIVVGVNVIDRIVLNDYFRGDKDILHEDNINNLLNLILNSMYNYTQYIVHDDKDKHNILNKNADKIRLLLPQKTIWIYTGYTIEQLFECPDSEEKYRLIPMNKGIADFSHWTDDRKRREIIYRCDVLVDGRYVNSQRDVSLKWRGSSNQRVIDVKKSLQQNKVVLYCD